MSPCIRPMATAFFRLRHAAYLKARRIPGGRVVIRGLIFLQTLKDRHRLRGLMRRHGFEACERIYGILTMRGITHWADHGTMLGIVREGGFIRHDLDIDYSIPRDVKLYDVYCALSDNGFVLERGYACDGELEEITMSYRGVGIDFFKCHPVEGKMGNYVFVPELDPVDWKVRNVMAHERVRPNVKGVRTVSFGRNKTTHACIPANAEEILTAEYGDWRTPDSKTDFCGRNVPSHYREVYEGCQSLGPGQLARVFATCRSDTLRC